VLRADIKPLVAGTGLTEGITGSAAQQLDSQQSSNRADQIVLLSTLSVLRSIGPALAIAVAVTLLANLTLVPAVVSLLGTKVFWPSKAWQREPSSARYAAIGSSMRRRPVVYAVVAGLVLAALSVAAFSFKATFDLGSAGIPANAESQTALKTLEKGLPPGATDPTVVLLHARSGQPLSTADLSAYQAKLKGLADVGAVSAPQLGAGRATAAYTVTLTLDPTSTAAVHAVEGPIRTGAHAAAPAGTYALVGGTTAVFADIQRAVNHDYALVFPVAAAIILVMLGLMLRSLVAPWYLMASVGLGFGAALGATVLFFQDVRGQAGLVFPLPVYIYVFVVALGTDYNILMVARLREETAEGRSPREAAALALRHAGPTVGAAGLILAGTFASLALAGNSILAQLGFAVSSGIVLAAFVVATFFTPSVTALVGRAAWWPGDSGPPATKAVNPPATTAVPPVRPEGADVSAGKHRRDGT
jgi:putative drug exporter of the RND superfamily